MVEAEVEQEQTYRRSPDGKHFGMCWSLFTCQYVTFSGFETILLCTVRTRSESEKTTFLKPGVFFLYNQSFYVHFDLLKILNFSSCIGNSYQLCPASALTLISSCCLPGIRVAANNSDCCVCSNDAVPSSNEGSQCSFAAAQSRAAALPSWVHCFAWVGRRTKGRAVEVGRGSVQDSRLPLKFGVTQFSWPAATAANFWWTSWRSSLCCSSAVLNSE